LESDFEVAGESGTATEALDRLKESAVDIVLLDLGFGLDHANEFIATARASGFGGRFLIVTASTDVSSAALAFRLGVSGVFLKSDPPERLVQAIRLIQTGAVWVDQKTVQLLAEQCANSPDPTREHQAVTRLDDREQKVVDGILHGLTNRKIGDAMGISEGSVKNILQVVFGRAGVRTRSQLVCLAMEGLLGDFGHGRKRARKVRERSLSSAVPPAP
jgi:DNA-binding NarL/FixJ family response regulator